MDCPVLQQSEEGVMLAVKVVLNAKTPSIAEVIGERLKIRVSAPPEGGKANASVCKLLVDKLDVSARSVTIVRGNRSQEKTVCIEGLTLQAVASRLGI